MKIGVLSLQGDFSEHEQTLARLKVNAIEVRRKEHFDGINGLIIPGGESTVFSIMLKRQGLEVFLREKILGGLPVFGTCAGAIILSKKIVNEKNFSPLGVLGIHVKRNSYGRQVESFETNLKVRGLKHEVKGFFIRAPEIVKVDKGIEVLARLGNKPVLVKQENILASTFHTEIIGETAIHELFLMECEKQAAKI
ncbi:MAG: pyridoxal 5'-phosphate synthase glutaminase subunit PdxT [Candidatus Diapherotrites archaeon]|nr:pyridoxal 5'-phosphate synthase glutaminase subunit PdxT [Candidatus Diapherotrites archaeon]